MSSTYFCEGESIIVHAGSSINCGDVKKIDNLNKTNFVFCKLSKKVCFSDILGVNLYYSFENPLVCSLAFALGTVFGTFTRGCCSLTNTSSSALLFKVVSIVTALLATTTIVVILASTTSQQSGSGTTTTTSAIPTTTTNSLSSTTSYSTITTTSTTFKLQKGIIFQNMMYTILFQYVILAVLITGGINNGPSVELFNPQDGFSCSLPSLPDQRYEHTMDGSLICGGGWDLDAQTSCLQWNSTSGTWYKSHSLWRTRKQHCSWTPGPGNGTYLLGPDGDGMSSELVTPDGSVRPEGPVFSYVFRSLNFKSILNLQNIFF